MRAVPIDAGNTDDNGAFGDRLLVGRRKLFEERFTAGAFMDFPVTRHLQTSAAGIIHEEEEDAVVVQEIGKANILPIAAQIGEGDALIVQDVDEPGRPATVLQVGPAVSVIDAM